MDRGVSPHARSRQRRPRPHGDRRVRGEASRPTPTVDDRTIRAPVEISDDRAVVEAELRAGGKVCATCRGTFVAVKPDTRYTAGRPLAVVRRRRSERSDFSQTRGVRIGWSAYFALNATSPFARLISTRQNWFEAPLVDMDPPETVDPEPPKYSGLFSTGLRSNTRCAMSSVHRVSGLWYDTLKQELERYATRFRPSDLIWHALERNRRADRGDDREDPVRMVQST